MRGPRPAALPPFPCLQYTPLPRSSPGPPFPSIDVPAPCPSMFPRLGYFASGTVEEVGVTVKLLEGGGGGGRGRGNSEVAGFPLPFFARFCRFKGLGCSSSLQWTTRLQLQLHRTVVVA